MSENKKFVLVSVCIIVIYTAALYFLGFFSIGLLSDDYLNFYDALHSSLYEKLTGTLPFTNAFHIRPVYYLSLQKSVAIHDWLGFAADDFWFYRFQNLALLLFTAFLSGLIVLRLTKKMSPSVVILAAVLLYPNNVNNICWTAARVDLLCSFFYLISLYIFLLYYDYRKLYFLVLTVITFTLALLTKELAVTLPFTLMLFAYFIYGKEGIRSSKKILISVFSVFVIYFICRILFLGNNISEIATLYQGFPLENAPGVIARGLISLSIPLDYLALNYLLRNHNKILYLYLLILYGSGAYFIRVMIRTEVSRYIGQVLSVIFLMIIPYAVIGYIRPQMIFLPFIITAVFILWLYSKQRKTSLKLNKTVLRITFIITLGIWSFWTGETVSDWLTSYQKAKLNAVNLLKLDFDRNKKLVLIGNPGRFKQTFMFDKMTGAYNFMKEGDFVIKDTIIDLVQTAAVVKSSVGAKPEYKITGENEFEIKVTAPRQFFYIEGLDNERIRSGFSNEDFSVEFTEYNNISKPIRLKLKILNPGITCYLASELDFIKLY